MKNNLNNRKKVLLCLILSSFLLTSCANEASDQKTSESTETSVNTDTSIDTDSSVDADSSVDTDSSVDADLSIDEAVAMLTEGECQNFPEIIDKFIKERSSLIERGSLLISTI